MTIWSDQLDQIYDSEIGKDATLNAGSGATGFAVRVIDNIAGSPIANDARGEILSVEPTARLRMSELTDNSLTRDDLDNGTLTLNEKAWRIKAHILKPNPDGELKGEVILILTDEDI
jgi:hypothetical protein